MIPIMDRVNSWPNSLFVPQIQNNGNEGSNDADLETEFEYDPDHVLHGTLSESSGNEGVFSYL